MLRDGFIDLHSHLLPGIDDGCETVEQALDCISQLIDAGFVGSVCSPHVCVRDCLGNTPATIAEYVRDLQAAVDRAGLDYKLWAGAEVRLDPMNVEWFEEHGVPVLGDGRYVLVDYFGNDWPEFCDSAIDYLLLHGYQPLLAHPERMHLEDAELGPVLVRLRMRGVLLQGNLRCLTGTLDGPRARERMQRLLDERHYHAVATDAHSPTDLPHRLAGIGELRNRLDEAVLRKLLGERPRDIVGAATGTLAAG